jgi:hypothetical protein
MSQGINAELDAYMRNVPGSRKPRGHAWGLLWPCAPRFSDFSLCV